MKPKKIHYLLLFLLLIIGCGKNNISNTTPNIGFKFVPYLEENGKRTPLIGTRSLTTDLSTGYRMIGFTTDTPLQNGDNPLINLQKLFWDTQTTLNGDYEGEKRNWVTNGKTCHSFYAYSTDPTGTQNGYGIGTNGTGGVGDTHNKPYIGFTQHDDPTKQIDFLVINSILNVQTDVNVPVLNLYFRHRLSRVAFMLYCSGGAALLECVATITYRPTTVKNHATLVLVPGGYNNFNGTGHHSGTHKIHKEESFTLPSSANTIDNAIFVGDLMIIPQQEELPLGYLTFDLKYKVKVGEDYRYARVDLDAISLVSEMQHSYYINIQETNVDLSVTRVTLNPWVTRSVMVDELK